jgi:hypothetical protein
MMIKCVHCDVDAYYRLTIEDFNKADSYSLDLCIKCIKIEVKKIIDDIPAIKSLKIEPVLSVSATTTAAAILDYEESNSINGSLAAATVLTAGLAVVPSTVQKHMQIHVVILSGLSPVILKSNVNSPT